MNNTQKKDKRFVYFYFVTAQAYKPRFFNLPKSYKPATIKV